jgi:hypothetical protein
VINHTTVQVSPSKGKKVVKSSSSTNSNEKFNDEAKDEKTTSSIRKNELQRVKVKKIQMGYPLITLLQRKLE